MAGRTSLTPKTAPGSYPVVSANSLDLAFAAADASNKNQFAASGNDLIIAHNTDSGAHTITLTSTIDPYNRTGDITAYSLGAGEYCVIGPLKLAGWAQSSGVVYLEADSALVFFGILAL